MKYTAICIFNDNLGTRTDSFATDETDCFKLADEMSAACGETPDSIVLLENGEQCPRHIATYRKGLDYGTHLWSLDRVADHLKDWIDGLDEESLVEALVKICGVEKAKLYADNKKVSFILP